MQSELDTTQTLLKETQEQLDKALLAQSVGELQAREADLHKQLDELEAELAHKGPLFDRSIDVSREIATLDQQLRSLTEQRSGLANELADLVSRIEQPVAGGRRDAQAGAGRRGSSRRSSQSGWELSPGCCASIEAAGGRQLRVLLKGIRDRIWRDRPRICRGGLAMNLTSLPRATLWTIGALVAALIGWGALVYSNVSHRNAAAEWAGERAALDGRVAELTGSEEELRQRVGELEGTLERGARRERRPCRRARPRSTRRTRKLSDRLACSASTSSRSRAPRRTWPGCRTSSARSRRRSTRAKASLNQRMAVLGRARARPRRAPP